MAHVKEITTSGGGGGGSSAPASNAGSAASSRGSSSAGGNYSRSGSPSASSKASPKPSTRSSGGGSRDSSAHAAASADRAAAAGRGKVATFTPTRKSSTPWALDWADGEHGSSKQSRFGGSIGNSGRPLSGQFSLHGAPTNAGVYAGGGLNPSAWGSSFLSPSRKGDSSKFQEAIDNLNLPTDYQDRNIHALDPEKGDKSYREKVDNWNYDRSVWAYNDTLGAFTREYESPEAQLTDMLDLMAHAQVYYKDSLDQDRKYTIDGKEVSAADAWKGLYDDLERYTSRLTDWGQIQDLYTKIQNGEEVTTMNVDALTARAQAQIGKATDDEDAAFWQDVVNNLGTLRIGVNREQYDKLSDAVAQRQAEFDAATEKIEDLYRSGGTGMLEDGSALETAGAERAAAKKALKEAKDALEAWTPNTNEERDALIAKMHEKASLLKGGLTEEEQRRLLELDAELYNPQIDYGKDFVRRGALVGGMFEKAAGHVNKGVTSAANWLLGDLFDEFTALANTTASGLGIKKEIPNVVKGIDKFVEDTVAADEAYYGQNIAGSSVAKVVDQYGTMTAEALPMVVVAHLTGGASLTSEGLASMAAAEQGGTLARIAEGATQLIKSQAADPNFQFTFVQTFGQGYENALADGASTEEASVYALLNAYVNTSIEIGGGMQSLPEALASGDEGALKAYAKSILEEIGEEWRQTPAEMALKSLYKPVEMYSTEDGEAVINPRRGIESAKGAGFVAAVLGAPSTAVNIARNGVSGALGVDKDGRIVPALDGTAVRRGANRHDTAVTTLSDRMKAAGYVNPANPDEAYAAATTGAQGPRTDAEADQQSYDQEIEAEAERQAEAEEARKAEEARESNRKEDAKLEEQARIREQEAEGAKRAAQAFQDEQNAQLKAAQKAEKYAQLAHNAREFQAEQDFLRQAQQAKQAAEEAGRKAEEQLAMANSQSQAITAQEGNVSPAPANQEEANQEIAGSQPAALAGQDSSPVEAPQKADLATASETAPGAQATSTQANTKAEGIEAVKPTANEQGEVSASIATAEEGRAAIESGETNNKTVAEVIPMVDKHVSESEPISTVAQNVFESRGSGKTPLSDRVANWIKSRFPTGVHSKAINGNVIVDKRGIKNDIAHGVGEAKAATFAAVPDVLDKGTIVSRSDGSVKNRSVTIAGKVMLNGSPVNVYCVVKQNSGDNRFYLHEVSDGNGTVFYKLGQNNNATPALLDSTGTNPASADVASTVSIAQNQANSNTVSINESENDTITAQGIERGPDKKQVDKLISEDKSDDSIQVKWTKALSKLGYYVVQPVMRSDHLTYYVLDGDKVYEVTGKGLKNTAFASASDFWGSGEIRRNTETYSTSEYLKDGQNIKALMERIAKKEAEEAAVYRKKSEDYNARLLNTPGKYQNSNGELIEIERNINWFNIFDSDGNLLKKMNLPDTERYIKDNGFTKMQVSTNPSTNVQADGTINKENAKKGVPYEEIENLYEDFVEDPSDGQLDGEPGVPGRSGDDNRKALADTGAEASAQLERDGARRVKEENWTPGVKKLIQRFKTDGLSAATLHDRTNYKGTFAKGFSLKTAPNDGIFGSYNAKLNTGERSRGRKPEGLGQLLAHEYAHNTFTRKNFEQCKEVIEAAYDSIGLSGENRDDIRDRLIWARGYKEYSSGYSRADWQKLSREKRLNIIEALPDSTKEEVYERLFNELASDVVGNRENFAFGDYFSFLREAALAEFVERKIFSPRFAIGLDADIEAADAESDSKVVTEEPETNINQNSFIETVSENLEDVAEIEQTQQTSVGRTPGRVKQSQSAFEQDVATKGERANTDTAMGEAEFLSRTNEARSRTADALTDTQEKADAQAQRLLQEDYVWNDDDVVIAQKLMFDMLKGIRDYQMNKTSRMKPDAFRKMTEQYNQLMTKHQQRLSESGQTLQANYMFSTGDKIVMKAAQTFLGFTKDGRFAGGAVNAKNATIYAGIEEAAKRIQSAVDAKDVQSLAKICKDISDIRNVKKMFGPLGGFASEMENRVLNRIAKGENAAENLENLAYGNLNAVCDDVQPYKALNAAKTIRVMNMLSNTATIVNNLANNFAQGAVSKSMVNQALSNLASKPFEALTGQQVISKAQRGREANKAVRNAQTEALETATLMQMYGITEENGRLELNDRGMFNPNINPFEQTMSLYKFLTGMGVEATDKMQAAGILKSMELGIDADIKAGKIEAQTKEQRMQEARHEVNRLLYKDDNEITAWVQHGRDVLNKKFHIGNDRVGTIGLGDITMAFAKIPTNVVRARLAMTPEGALLQVAQYAKGVNKAKRMHAEVLAKGIVDSYREQIDAANTALQSAYEMEWSPAKDAAIRKAQSELSRLNSKMWAEAQDVCRGSVYRNLRTLAQNYNENMMFDEAVERAGYMNAKEMSQFEAAQLSRKIGRAATSAGMMALGSVLRALGALRDFDQEPDDELRKMNSDKGYRGLMMNLSAIGRKNHEWKDGDLIIDGEFLEVIAMPLTIGATAAEAAATAQDAKTWSWLKSMAGNGIAKTFEAVGDIPGMADAINMYESLTSAYTNDYDEKTSRLLAGLLQYAANTVPSFFVPNSVSQAAAGFDNKVRDVYAADTVWGQAKNIFMNKVPVLRNKVPVSVDVWGNERTYGEGPWGAINKMLLPGDVHVYRQNKYEAEIERLVREGYGNATPKTTVNSSFEVGDEKYTMTAQEKLDFKAARNSEQKELFEAFLDSKYYDQLNDAERMKVLQSLKTNAERDAKQDMLDSRQLNVQITRDKWETELLDVNDQIQFLTAKQLANNVLDRDAEDMDYAAVDQFLTGTYRGLSTTQRDLLNSSFSRLDDMYEAKFHYGISSEAFNKGYDIYKDYMSQEGKDRVKGGYKDWEGSQMYTDIAKATGASEKQMDFFEDKFVLYNSNAVVPEKYNTLVDSGWGRESAQALVKNVADLTPTNGRKNVSYKQRLTAIATTSGLTEAQRWEAFYEDCPSSYTNVIKFMSRYKSNGFSYEKALKAAGKWDP